MPVFRCLVGRIGELTVPPLFSDAATASVIASAFSNGSSGNIQLALDLGPLDASFVPVSQDGLTRPLDLHLAAAWLLGPPPPAPARVDRIGVLLARRYVYQPALGVMFDRGFVDLMDGDTVPQEFPEIAGRPREACALFTDAVAKYWESVTVTDDGMLFTCIHEIGHIFNLRHYNSEENILTEFSPKVIGADFWRFAAHHSAALARNPLLEANHPGETKFYPVDPYALPEGSRRRRSNERFGLRLEIAPSRYEFFDFEPVELLVRLAVVPDVDARFSVPDEVDPGYRSFRIWIEDPDGERRIYRSPRRYCSCGRKRVIASKRPFERDISIFGESGGYTFRKPGRHRLWAELDAGFAAPLRSNSVEVNLLPWTALSGPMTRFAELLPRRLGKVIAYHRLLPSADARTDPYERLVEDSPELPARSELRYALGCAYAATKGGGWSRQEKARRWLAEAAGDRLLDAHRRANAARRLSRLPRNRAGSQKP